MAGERKTVRVIGLTRAAWAMLGLAATLMAQPPASKETVPARPGQSERGARATDNSPLGTVPGDSATPRLEFVFEENVTLGHGGEFGGVFEVEVEATLRYSLYVGMLLDIVGMNFFSSSMI